MQTIIIFLLLGMLSFTACKNVSSSKNEDTKLLPQTILEKGKGGRYFGGTFKVNQTNRSRSLDPHGIIDVVGFRIAGQVLQGLVKHDVSNLNIIPSLAKSWKIDETRRIYTFNLRTDVYFHEDECFGSQKTRKFNAHDVKYCFTKLCEPSPKNRNFYLFKDQIKGALEYHQTLKEDKAKPKEISGIKVINDSVISILLESPSEDFLKILCTQGGWIFPKEAIEYYESDFENNLIGTGPFKFVGSKHDEKIVLSKNHKYWDYDEYGNQKPFLDKIEVSFNKSKRKEILSFRKGEIDMVWSVPVYLINDLVGDIEEARRGKNIPYKIQSTTIMEVYYLGFNHNIKPFNNKLVRQAISHAINKDELVIFELKGEGLPAKNGFVPPSVPRYPFNKVKSYPYDPSKARKLLKKAGYNKRNKFPNITFQFDETKKNSTVARYVKQMLMDNLGINLNFKELDFGSHYEALDEGSVGFWRASWVGDFASPTTFIGQMYSGPTNLESKDTNHFSPNLTKYNNQKFDSVYIECLRTKNRATQMDCFAEADQILMEDAGVIPLIYEERINLINLKVENFYTNNLSLWDFSEVYFKPINPKAKNLLKEN